MNVQLGDLIYGYCKTRRRYVYIQVSQLSNGLIFGQGFTHGEAFCGPIKVETALPAEIYLSPLYQALKEDE